MSYLTTEELILQCGIQADLLELTDVQTVKWSSSSYASVFALPDREYIHFVGSVTPPSAWYTHSQQDHSMDSKVLYIYQYLKLKLCS